MSGKGKATSAVKAPSKAAASSSSSKKSGSSSSSKKGAPAASKSFAATHAHLFSKQTKSFGIGRSIPPPKSRDLSRYVLWPKYIRLQRQRAILKKRLKVPPAINQFSRALDKNGASNLFRLLANYRPETEAEKKARLTATAADQVKGKDTTVKTATKPYFVKYGLNHITHLVETKKAKLVVIAHDVEPIELVVWLPALCRKLQIPYVIVKGKSRLGHLVYKKTATALAITETRKEDAPKLEQIIEKARAQFNDADAKTRSKWGGGVMGIKAQHVQRARERAIQKELASKGL
jgi:large subunit ribosomal protein L7Ae